MSIIPLWAKALAIAVLVVMAVFAINALDQSRQKIGYNKAAAEYSVKLLGAQEDARAQSDAWIAKQLKEREITSELLNARDAKYHSAINTIGGLRNELTNIGNGLSSITATACRARIEALSSVFGECAERRIEVAKAAAGQFIDSMTCRAQWPTK